MIVSFRHDQERVMRRRKLLGALFAVSLLMFILRGPLAVVFGGWIAIVGTPVWHAGDWVVAKRDAIHALLSSKVSLAKENERLRAELDAIIVESLSRDQLQEDNLLFKQQLGRAQEGSLLLARVLSTPGTSPYDTFIVDVGSTHGVVKGMEVYGDGDFIIGEVTTVWESSAVVTLYSTPGGSVSATIGTSSIPAVAHGTGGGNFRIMLPKGLPVAVGDIVEMPALSPEYLGVVGGVVRPEGTSLQMIFTALPFNIYEQRWVFISLKGDLIPGMASRTDRMVP